MLARCKLSFALMYSLRYGHVDEYDNFLSDKGTTFDALHLWQQGFSDRILLFWFHRTNGQICLAACAFSEEGHQKTPDLTVAMD
jgi:hypothetical protein